MGFNLTGIVINDVFAYTPQRFAEKFASAAGLDVEYIDEIKIKEAQEGHKPDGLLDIYFGITGTLVYLPFSKSGEKISLKGYNCFNFTLSDTSSKYGFSQFNGNEEIRSFLKESNQVLVNVGEKLEAESEEANTPDIIWAQIEEELGKSHESIASYEKAYRFKLVEKAAFITPEPSPVFEEKTEQEAYISEEVTHEDLVEEFEHPETFAQTEDDSENLPPKTEESINDFIERSNKTRKSSIKDFLKRKRK